MLSTSTNVLSKQQIQYSFNLCQRLNNLIWDRVKKVKNRQLLCLQNQGRFKEIKPSYEIRAVIAWDASSYC